jgi:S1-C subfamily serine protease
MLQRLLRCAVWLLCWAALPAAQSEETAAPPAAETSKALERAANAVVGLQAVAVAGARSADTLGRQRAGSGVVIDADGLVLTIGYLILEAEQVQLITDDQRRIPARIVAYDLATGFGLVRALAPLRLEPAPLGRGRELQDEQMLMIVSGGEAGAVSAARLVSRRAFAGYWEYLLEDALFTAPPRPDHSGAGLFNHRGELVGIGSLIVADAGTGSERRVPGNMFVPLDLLPPILPELIARGRSSLSERAWMGINCVDAAGRVRVLRVSEDSPAEVAGLEAGDVITGLDGAPVRSLQGLWTALWQGSSRRAVQLDIERSGEKRSLTVHTVDRAATLRRAEGV